MQKDLNKIYFCLLNKKKPQFGDFENSQPLQIDSNAAEIKKLLQKVWHVEVTDVIVQIFL